MTTKFPKTGITISRATSKCLKQNVWHYSMSDGSTLRMGSDKLELGSWYFLEVYKDAFEVHHYKSHYALPTDVGQELTEDLIALKGTAITAAKMWDQLNINEQHIIARGIGVGVAGTASAAYGISGLASTLAAESLLGALTGGLSMVLGAGLGILSYSQYCDLKRALSSQKALVDRYTLQMSDLSFKMGRFLPAEYRALPTYNPDFTELLARGSQIFKNFNIQRFINFNSNSDQLEMNFA